MQLSKLFTMQRELDYYIQQQRNVHSDVFNEKALALLVELAELANETRCFKFWSQKGPSDPDIILEEYVDSIHFLLSLGLEKGFEQQLLEWAESEIQGSLTLLFMNTNGAIIDFINEPSFEHYRQIWNYYSALAKALGFTNEQIVQAYISKNEENYERQQKGY